MHTLALLQMLAAQSPPGTVITTESVVLAIVTVLVSVGVAWGLLKGRVDAADKKIGELNDRVKALESTSQMIVRIEERLISIDKSVIDGFFNLRRELEHSGVYPRKGRGDG